MSRAGAPRALTVECVVRSAFNETLRVRKTGRARWSAQADTAFLEALARTGNVRAAAAAAGFSTEACYQQRMRRPDFAADWARALALGYERLEDMLVERVARRGWRVEIEGDCLRIAADEGKADGDGDGDWEGEALPSFADIVRLLRMHRGSVRP